MSLISRVHWRAGALDATSDRVVSFVWIRAYACAHTTSSWPAALLVQRRFLQHLFCWRSWVAVAPNAHDIVPGEFWLCRPPVRGGASHRFHESVVGRVRLAWVGRLRGVVSMSNVYRFLQLCIHRWGDLRGHLVLCQEIFSEVPSSPRPSHLLPIPSCMLEAAISKHYDFGPISSRTACLAPNYFRQSARISWASLCRGYAIPFCIEK